MCPLFSGIETIQDTGMVESSRNARADNSSGCMNSLNGANLVKMHEKAKYYSHTNCYAHKHKYVKTNKGTGKKLFVLSHHVHNMNVMTVFCLVNQNSFHCIKMVSYS